MRLLGSGVAGHGLMPVEMVGGDVQHGRQVGRGGH